MRSAAHFFRWPVGPAFRGLEIAPVLPGVFRFRVSLSDAVAKKFLFASVCGLVAFLIVERLGHILDSSGQAEIQAAAGGDGAFLSLDVLGAGFSFDGVTGGFALTQNLFLIAMDPGIGALYSIPALPPHSSQRYDRIIGNLKTQTGTPGE